MRYRMDFIGRQVGALGISYAQVKYLEAETEEEAQAKLYETHEHIQRLTITPAEEGSPA